MRSRGSLSSLMIFMVVAGVTIAKLRLFHADCASYTSILVFSAKINGRNATNFHCFLIVLLVNTLVLLRRTWKKPPDFRKIRRQDAIWVGSLPDAVVAVAGICPGGQDVGTHGKKSAAGASAGQSMLPQSERRRNGSTKSAVARPVRASSRMRWETGTRTSSTPMAAARTPAGYGSRGTWPSGEAAAAGGASSKRRAPAPYCAP